MTRRISLKKAFAGYRKYLKELRQPELECAKNCFENNYRRRVIAQRFRNKFIDRNFERLGINQDEYLALQARDEKSAQNFLRKQRQKVHNFGKERANRQRRLRDGLPKRGAVLHGLKNPPYRRCVAVATGIFIDGFSLGGNVTLSDFVTRTANFDNSARQRASIQNDGFCLIFMDFHFIWVAESDGILYPEAQVYFNGAWQRHNPSDCRDHNYAQLIVWSDFSVSQTDLSGVSRALSAGSREALYSRNVDHHGSHASNETVNILPDRDFVTLDAPRMEIVEGLPVLFTATVGFYLNAGYGADVTFDFHTEPYEINVGVVSFEVVT